MIGKLSKGTRHNPAKDDLATLGATKGPFWNDLPPGVSGDPANTDEGRPGVLLVSQQTYEAITAGELE